MKTLLAVLLLAASLPALGQDEDGMVDPASDTSAPVEAPAKAGAASAGEASSDDLEVVIKGSGGKKLKNTKPPISVKVDPYSTIQESLQPDEDVFLADAPDHLGWRGAHPEFIDDPRVIEPWRVKFGERAGITFRPARRLVEIMGRPVDEKEMKHYRWNLSIADSEGRVFQRYSGSGEPPAELMWNGRNDKGEWISPGRAYSAVFQFTDALGSPHTGVGRPIQFTGVVHQEESGLFISLDSASLFGPTKDATEWKGGEAKELLRAAADLIKRQYHGIPLRVNVFSHTQELAGEQARSVAGYLESELMAFSDSVSNDGYRSPYSDQRVDILVLNR